MGRKFIFNVLLNIGLIAMIFTAVSSYKREQYFTVIISISILIVLSFLKIRLLKQVRAITKDHSKTKN